MSTTSSGFGTLLPDTTATHTVRSPTDHLDGTKELALSPFDFTNMGRSIPMVWYYEDTLNPMELIEALEKTLAIYPVFSGRYNKTPPTAIALTNAGVPVEVCSAGDQATLADAVAHLPRWGRTSHSIFSREAHEPFVPEKSPMDPDVGSTEAPVLAIRITSFSNGGGTAIGLLLQHGVADADAQIAFVRNWSRLFRGLEPDPLPILSRELIDSLSLGRLQPVPGDGRWAQPEDVIISIVRPGEVDTLTFLGVMPMIYGPSVCVAPLAKHRLAEWKAEASMGLPTGAFVSTDDVATARVWRSLCRMRCAQLGLGTDSDDVTTCSRALNLRARTDPPLGAGFCANGVSQVWTTLSVRDLLALPVGTVALRLRESIQACTPEVVAARARWFQQMQEEGCKVTQAFDEKALTFIVSSWGFDWEGANFRAPPICFDHGALAPIVAVMAPRAQDDGLNVWASGPEESLRTFCAALLS